MSSSRKFHLPLLVFLFVAFLLTMVQLKVENPMLLLERFIPGAGWFEIILIGLYGALVAFKMQDPAKVQSWRRYTWLAFSAIFFSQLALGLAGQEKFLMTGKLHFPIPMMILSGPIYRGHASVMTILFISTVILSGPAWCSHLCYFGAIDGIASINKPRRGPVKNKMALKATILLLVIATTILLRLLSFPLLTATIMAAGFGVIGLGIIILISARQGRMIHCISYCPIGTIVNYGKFINPFRMYIDNNSCTDCMGCTKYCKYDALNGEDILNRKPGITCTLCGDCVTSCHSGSIKYRFLHLSPKTSRNLWLFITISLHAATIALARI